MFRFGYRGFGVLIALWACAPSAPEDSPEPLVCLNDGWSPATTCHLGPDPFAPDFPTSLSQTGCFQADNRTPGAGLFEYDIASPLWTDGEHKRRFIVVPEDLPITARWPEVWDLPVGTILIKEFSVGARDATLEETIPLETRFLSKVEPSVWLGATYRWDAALGDAILIGPDPDVSETSETEITDAEGTRSHRHYYPSRTECSWCHVDEAGGALGIHTGLLNMPIHTCERELNQIERMVELNLVDDSQWSEGVHTLPRLPIPTDTNESLETRARSYLHSNCSHCHMGAEFPPMDLRWHIPFSETVTCEHPAYRTDIGDRLIEPGNKEESVLWLRVSSRDVFVGMPPVATYQIDDAGARLIGEWIDSLEGCP